MARQVQKKRKRAPWGSLTEARIVTAGLAILAREGLPAVGIRSVAQELSVAPMSLYRHVRNHEALLDLVRQHVLTPPDGLPVLEGLSWREGLRSLLCSARVQLRRYPRAVIFFNSENFHQPSASLAVEQALRCLADAGLSQEQAARASAALWMYTIGSVLAEESPCAAWPGEELTAQQRGSWAEDLQQQVGELAPRVVAMTKPWASLTHEAVFVSGLELLLDGVAASVVRSPC